MRTVTADAATSTVRLNGTMTAADVVAALSGTPYVVHVLQDAPPDAG